MFGNAVFSASMITFASSVESVVCVRYTSLSGSSILRCGMSAGDSTTWVCSGASPLVPMISWWSRWPTSRIW